MKCLILLFALFAAGCVAPPIFTPTQNVSVAEIEGVDAGEAHSRARQWFSEYFTSSKSVIDYESEKDGVIAGTGIATLAATNGGMTHNSVKYSIRVETKDGRIRVTTKPLAYLVGGHLTQRAREGVQADGLSHLASMSEKIRLYILNPKIKSDW